MHFVQLPLVVRNGESSQAYPGCLNLSFAYVEGESLLMALKNVALSSGSAFDHGIIHAIAVIEIFSTSLLHVDDQYNFIFLRSQFVSRFSLLSLTFAVAPLRRWNPRMCCEPLARRRILLTLPFALASGASPLLRRSTSRQIWFVLSVILPVSRQYHVLSSHRNQLSTVNHEYHMHCCCR